MNLISWNCRGLGGKQKLEAIKRFKSIEANSILNIQDTKMQQVDCLNLMKRTWDRGEGVKFSKLIEQRITKRITSKTIQKRTQIFILGNPPR